MAVENYTIDAITQAFQNILGEMLTQIANFSGLIILGSIMGLIFGSVYMILRFARGRR